jgi:DNA sulfur modification protein DndE
MSIEQITLSKQAREQLIRLKRRTGIEHWNVLCRWALCRSLAEPSVPPATRHPADSNVEMTWKVFGGKNADLYLALIEERCIVDGLMPDPTIVAQQFRLHLHRGISYLAADRSINDIDALTALAA